MKKAFLISLFEFKKQLYSNRLAFVFILNLSFIVFAYFKVFKVHNRLNFDSLMNTLFLACYINLLVLCANNVWEEKKNGTLKLLFSSNVSKVNYFSGKTFFVSITNLLLLLMVSLAIIPLNFSHFAHFLPDLLFLLIYLFLFSISLIFFLTFLSIFLPNYLNSLVYFLALFGLGFAAELGKGFSQKLFKFVQIIIPDFFRLMENLKNSLIFNKFNPYLILHLILLIVAYFIVLIFSLKREGVNVR